LVSITVRANWRVIFRFVNGIALDVDLVDYHSKRKAHADEESAASGELLGDNLPELGWNVTAAAKGLGISRQQLHNIIAGRSAITPELAVKLEKAIGSTADAWLRMQSAHDLAKVRSRAIGSKIKRFEPVWTASGSLWGARSPPRT
jgi:antitoxin HigA-1